MDKRISSEITKKIKSKFKLNLRMYAYTRNITLNNLRAFISGTRNNFKVYSVLVTDGIISSTHQNNKNQKKGYKYEQL